MSNIYIFRAKEGRHLLAKHPMPEYPPAARAAGVYGTVVLQAHVGADGRVSSLDVVSGPGILQQAALDAVWNWTFKQYKPYNWDRKPTEVITIVEVFFQKALPLSDEQVDFRCIREACIDKALTAYLTRRKKMF